MNQKINVFYWIIRIRMKRFLRIVKQDLYDREIFQNKLIQNDAFTEILIIGKIKK